METVIMTHNQERRIFLAKMLKIPPALLGLDWRLVIFENNKGAYKDPLSREVELIEEDPYYAYEDILVMGQENIHTVAPIQMPNTKNPPLKPLTQITQNPS